MRDWRRKNSKKAKGKKVPKKGPSLNEKQAAKAIVEEVEANERKKVRKSVKDAIEDGLKLIKAGEILSGGGYAKRVQWGKHLKDFKSQLEIRTVQRYIKLAKNVDLEKHPNLAYLGQANLLRLIQLGDGETPAALLRGEGVDLDFDSSDAEERKLFQSETAKLIKNLATERRESKKGDDASSKDTDGELVRAFGKIHKLIRLKEEVDDLEDRLEENKGLKRILSSCRVFINQLLMPTREPGVSTKGKGRPHLPLARTKGKFKRPSG